MAAVEGRRRRRRSCSLLLLPRRRSATEEVERLASAVKELEIQAAFEEKKEAEVEECLAVAEELHRRHDSSPSLRRRS